MAVKLTKSALPSGAATSAKQDDQNDTVILLRRIVKLLESSAVVDSANRQKIAIEGTSTVTTVTTVGTVSSLTNMAAMGGVDPRYLLIDTARNAYANNIRSKLVFT